MEKKELLRRIDEALRRKGLSRAAASRQAGLSNSFIRDLDRHPEVQPRLRNLVALAQVLGVPVDYLTKDLGPAMSEDGLDTELRRLAFRAADQAVRGFAEESNPTLRGDIAAVVYEVLLERSRAGEDPGSSLPAIDATIRRLLMMLLARR